MFRTVPLSIIRSFSLYTQQWYMSANLYDIYHCCVYSEKLLMMDRGAVWKMKFHSKNKFEKLMHLVGFIVRNLSRCTVAWTSKSISTLELFNMVADYHSVLHVALYSTSTHFCCTELPFVYMNTAPFYGFHLWMMSLNTTFAHKIHVHSCTCTPI